MGGGFSSGLPLYFIYQLIPAWLRTEGLDLTTIGALSLVSLPYTIKFLWAPFLDRHTLFGMGRRRSWALATQVALWLSLAAFSALSVEENIEAITVLCGLVAIFSATQDIALDAYRRELLSDAELGLGNSLAVNAYRLSSLVPGSLGLIVADHMSWSSSLLIVSVFMGIGMATSWFMPEPTVQAPPARRLWDIVVEPMLAFFRSRGVVSALGVLGFMLLYKLGDTMATALATPFYLDLGFSMTEVGTVVKAASLWSSIAGGTIGGVVMVWLGINRALWLFGLVQIASILGFAWLSEVGPHPGALFAVVSFEYLGVGLGTAAFVAFIARNTDPRYTAFQLALLTGLTGVPRTFAGATTGVLIETLGYTSFFLLCFVIAIPGMLMLPWVAPWSGPPATGSATEKSA